MQRIIDRRTGREWETVRELVRYVTETQHSYLRLVVPHLVRLQARLAAESDLRPRQLDKLGRQLIALSMAIGAHVRRQEAELFHELLRPSDRPVLSHMARDALEQLPGEHRRLLALCESALETAQEIRLGVRDGVVSELVRDLENLLARLQEHQRLEAEVLAGAVRERTLSGPRGLPQGALA